MTMEKTVVTNTIKIKWSSDMQVSSVNIGSSSPLGHEIDSLRLLIKDTERMGRDDLSAFEISECFIATPRKVDWGDSDESTYQVSRDI